VSRPSSCPPRSQPPLSIRSFSRLSVASSLLGCLPVRRSPPPRSTGAGRGDDAASVVPPVGQDLERGCAGADPELRLVCRSLAAVDAAPAAVMLYAVA